MTEKREVKQAGMCARLCCCLALCRFSRKLKKASSEWTGKEIEIDHSYKPNRWPTDVICLFLFIAYWMGMAIIAIFALERGDPRTLILPTDAAGYICGYFNPEIEDMRDEMNLTEKPVLWYPFNIDIENPEQSRIFDALDMGICVETCPTASMLTIMLGDDINETDLFANAQNAIVCEYDFQGDSTFKKIERVLNDTGGCYINWLPTTEFQSRCMPDVAQSKLTPQVKNLMKGVLYTTNALKAGLYELQSSWLIFILLVVVMFFICLLVLFLVQVFIKVFVYTTLFLLFFILGAIAAYSGWVGYRKYGKAQIAEDDEMYKWAYIWIGIAITLVVLECIYLVLMIFMLNRIGIAIEIIAIAAMPIRKVFWIVVVPPLTFLSAILLTVYWVIVAAYVQSSKISIKIDGSDFQELGKYINLNISENSTTILSGDKIVQAFQWYNVFGYFWTMAFILACGYCVVAAVVSAWYFSSHLPGKKTAGWFPVIRAFGRILLFHTGSILIGSLLVAIIQLIRLIVHQVEKKIKEAKGENKVTKALFKVLKVVLWICEKIIKFVNKNAYIIILIHGSNLLGSFFCFAKSSLRAMALILMNILQIGMVNFIGDFMLILGQIGLTLLGTVITYLMIDFANDVTWMNWMIYPAPTQVIDGVSKHYIEYAVLPTFAGFVISFIVSGLFVNMYSTSIDTILVCFCEDRKANNGKDKPYYAPLSLQGKMGAKEIEMHKEKK